MVMNRTLKDTTGNKANGFRFLNEDSVLALITSVAIDKFDKTYKYPIYNFKFEPKLERKLN